MSAPNGTHAGVALPTRNWDLVENGLAWLILDLCGAPEAFWGWRGSISSHPSWNYWFFNQISVQNHWSPEVFVWIFWERRKFFQKLRVLVWTLDHLTPCWTVIGWKFSEVVLIFSSAEWHQGLVHSSMWQKPASLLEKVECKVAFSCPFWLLD